MRLTPDRLDIATAALRAVLPLQHPADSALGLFFRRNPQLGAQDRAFIGENVFGILRHRLFLESAVEIPTPRSLLLAHLARFQGVNLRELAPLVSEAEAKWLGYVKGLSVEALSPEVRAEFPEWLIKKLQGFMGEDEILELGLSLQRAAPLDLRVNSLLADRDEIIATLAGDGIEAAPTPYSPLGIRLAGKPAINRHPLFLAGKVEVQDEGSQLLGYLLSPRRRDMVVDFCAGAGGKTLMLGALMHSHGRIYAFDTSDKRLKNLGPRLKRSGLSNLYPQHIVNENDIKVKRLAGKIDRVLVDAPCSGMGTLRRNPDLKWRQSPQSIEELKHKQMAILSSAANLLKPGGRLVYATCSFFPEENQDVVEHFLNDHPAFTLVNCADVLRQQKITLDTGLFLELSPRLHGTDGFFAAAMELKKS
ncbi:MAG TPA: RsmB/NOP family class I SAM-dependent RNA methyltransferase [Nitrosospira sp.]|jgi:16S rRNA (cytosine967-C5)-methyltransferase|nr:RsmB/NOP family class I SAM-dependent RNA methyltransferase [Nitrosospira sp.]